MPSRRFLVASLALATAVGVASLRAQTATIGYSPVANPLSPTVLSFTGASLNANTAFIVPFQINTLGDYSLSSVSLLLAGNASLANFSLSVSSTLPTDLTPPSALTTFSATGTLNPTEAAYNFTSGATPTLAANTTYYFRVAYTGTDTANWILTGGSAFTGSGSTPSLSFISSAFGADTLITYRSVASGAGSNDYGNMGAFSITASAVSAVPEPSTYAALAGGLTLAAALYVRRRQARAPSA
ncbi:MAG: hypothetical protein RLZZ15_1223 [Verrucomicrobiota bacterium]|jgi:hypothetical protein